MNGEHSQASAELTELPKPPASRTRQRLWLFAKLAVAGAAFAYVLSRQTWSELTAAMERITPAAVAAAIMLQLLCVVVATVRWRSLMYAYGATTIAPFKELLRVYFVGQFYNTYLPGGVGGDFVRAVVTRRSFPEGGATASTAIVFVERALGLLGVLVLTTIAVPLDRSSRSAHQFLPYSLLGILGIIALILAIAQGSRLAPYLPLRVAPLVRNLPKPRHLAALVTAGVLSVIVQLLFVVCGHVLVDSVYPGVRWQDSLLVIPLTAAASFFPLSIAGAGPRDAVLVTLYGLAGVPRSAGVATSLALLVVTLVAAATGGLWQMAAPVGVDGEKRS